MMYYLGMNKIVPITGLVGIVLVLAFATNLTSIENQASAQTNLFPSREKVISVTGVATATVDPDLLIVTLGVETQKDTAKDAFATNSESMNAIVSAIRLLGISDDDLSTSQLDIRPVYEEYVEDDKYRQELVGYRVTNALTIKTDQLDSAANIVDTAVDAGANMVHSVHFTLAPETQLEIKDDLLEQAVINAKTKAESALAPLNHKVTGVKLVSLSEHMSVYDEQAFGAVAYARSAPIFSSDQNIKTTVDVVFLIGSN